MKRCVHVLVPVLVALMAAGLPMAACSRSGGADVLELGEEVFRSEDGSVSLLYPQGWQQYWLERMGGTLLHAPEEPIEDIVGMRQVAQVAVVSIIVGPLADVPAVDVEGVQDSRTMLKAFLSWLKNSQISWIRRVDVDGHRGAAANIRFTMLDTRMAGRAVAVFQGDRAFFIEGAAPVDAWKRFAPTFEAMLETVSLAPD